MESDGKNTTLEAGEVLLGGITLQTNTNNNATAEKSPSTQVDALATEDINTEVDRSLIKEKYHKSVSCLRAYSMNLKHRGHAVIFNNENFHRTTGMNKRTGTDVDGSNLKRTFKKLGFNVSLFKDSTCKEMSKVIVNLAEKEDHTDKDCFVLAILSHGDDGTIYGTDGILAVKDIVDSFRGNVCPSLAGKPKIFIFQACRGTDHEVPIEPSGDVVDTIGSHQTVYVDAAPALTLPSGSDFLFCYSVAEGFYSHRDTVHGSWFIQDFTSVMEEYILKPDKSIREPIDFLEVLTVVNDRVSQRKVERCLHRSMIGKKQMPCFLSMLTKKLYLFPRKK